MSDRNWGILAAFAGIAALVTAAGFGAFYGSVYSAEKRHYQSIGPNSGQAYPADSPRNGLADISGVNSLAESVIAKPQPRNAQERQDRDLAAQEAMAVFGYWVFWAMVAQTALAGGALFALLKDLRQNRFSAERQLRAYLHITSASVRGVAAGQKPELSLVTENSGQTPAIHFEQHVQFAILPVAREVGELPLDSQFTQPRNFSIGPGRTMNSSDIAQEKLSDEQFESLKSDQAIFWFGYFKYFDTFGHEQITNFRATCQGNTGGGRGLKICIDGNSAT